MATDEPMTAGVAGRYAAALFELAGEKNQSREVETALNGFQALLDESKDLRQLVSSPVFSAEEQVKALGALLEKAGIGGLAANFFLLIARNRRLFAAPDMIKAYRKLAAAARGEVEAEVVSAVALSEDQLSALRNALAATAGRNIQLNTRVDPEVLGGLIVKIGSRMIDSSIRTKLNSMKMRMKEVR